MPELTPEQIKEKYGVDETDVYEERDNRLYVYWEKHANANPDIALIKKPNCLGIEIEHKFDISGRLKFYLRYIFDPLPTPKPKE